MNDIAQEQANPHPNNLRQEREHQAMISRVILAARCKKLAEQDELRYAAVTVAAIRTLEAGRSRPRRMTAATLSAALDVPVEKLFPRGLDDPIRNPDGNTRIPTDRRRGGRPRKQ